LPHIHIIHVGNTINKGTYALLKSEILELKKISHNLEVSISTFDVEILKNLEPSLKIYPPIIDIPYERADFQARKRTLGRNTFRYKFYALSYVILMFLQVLLSVVSSIFTKVGIRPIYRSNVLEQFKNCDLVVSTSDENFKEGSMYLPYNIYWKLACWSMLFCRMLDVVIAKKIFKKSVIVFPNSIGPFRTKIGRFLAKTALKNVDLLMLRESYSYSFFRNLKIEVPTIVTSDIALLLECCQTKPNNTLPNPAIGVCPYFPDVVFPGDRRLQYILAHSKVLDYLIEKYGLNVIFLPHEIASLKHDDLALSNAILQNMIHKDKAMIVNVKQLDEFRNYLEQLDLLVSSRMHPTVLACSVKVPTVSIFYDHKQTGFFKDLGLSAYLININQLCSENLLCKVELSWKNREKIKEQLALRVPALQEKTRKEIKKAVSKFLQTEMSFHHRLSLEQ
jgi:colanic acid/amylovoran biosynthesis protein